MLRKKTKRKGSSTIILNRKGRIGNNRTTDLKLAQGARSIF